jgi:hypothetical protein
MKERVERRPEKELDYLSYLLRLWRANDGKQHVWRASLENSLTSERQGFASLDELFEFLRQQTGTVFSKERVKGEKQK